MTKTTAQHMNRRAFTIPELLVSIFLLTLAMALVFPTLGAIKKLSGVTAGVNTVGAAAKAIRYYAGRDRKARFADIDPNTPGNQPGTYSGGALLFQPDGTIRLTENIPGLLDGSGGYLELGATSRSGYGDITLRDPLKLPRDVSAVGIARGGAFGSPVLYILPAPFAVRFDELGRLISRRSGSATHDEGFVYYDFDGDGRSPVSDDRPPGYNPDTWTASTSFEKVDSVIGVILYSRSQFKNDGGNWAGNSTTRGCGTNGNSACGSITDWMTTNGRPVLFSRYTGQAIRVQ